MNHQEAKETILRAVPNLSYPQRLIVQGVSDLETNYGNWGPDPALGAGSNNMGAVTDPSYHAAPEGQPPTPPSSNQFLHRDSRPATAKERAEGKPAVITYTTAFRKYTSPEAGFADVARTALKANVNQAIANGDLYGVSQAMHDNVYYTGVLPTAKQNIDAHFKRLNGLVEEITKATGDDNPFQKDTAPTIPPLAPDGSGSQSDPLSWPLPSSILQSVLRLGSQGYFVRVWQQILGVGIDGVFGRKTDIATRNFQSSNQLISDGVVGPKTWQKAEELHAGSGQHS